MLNHRLAKLPAMPFGGTNCRKILRQAVRDFA
jgi:hypothetical protein